MSTADIGREYGRAVDRLLESETAIKAMFDSGISIGHWMLMHSRIGIEPLGISTAGDYIMPVVAYDQIVDLIAWPAADPTTWRQRLGHAVLLGQELADRAALFDEPIAVYPTPLEWLKHFGEGCCVVDWSAYLPFHLSAQRMLVDDQHLAERLTRAMTVPPVYFEIRKRAA